MALELDKMRTHRHSEILRYVETNPGQLLCETRPGACGCWLGFRSASDRHFEAQGSDGNRCSPLWLAGPAGLWPSLFCPACRQRSPWVHNARIYHSPKKKYKNYYKISLLKLGNQNLGHWSASVVLWVIASAPWRVLAALKLAAAFSYPPSNFGQFAASWRVVIVARRSIATHHFGAGNHLRNWRRVFAFGHFSMRGSSEANWSEIRVWLRLSSHCYVCFCKKI